MPRISRKKVAQGTGSVLTLWKAGLYLRLSEKDEGNKDVSNSIENQRALLVEYVQKDTSISQTAVYIDDGKTGTNLIRPGFQNLLEDIKKKHINCVIVKDLSRLGRNLYEMGAVLETIFPLYGVRFIAVTDQFDSENTNAAETGYIVPVKNLLNASYITDLSKKSKSARKVMREKGQYIGAYPIYGYQKSFEDKHSLIIDPEASNVVKMIFNMAEQGTSINKITGYLNQQNIETPAQYRKKKQGMEAEGKNVWYNGTVRHILNSMIYTGTLVQGQFTVMVPKGKKIKKPKEEWSIIENAHEYIIEKERFEKIHQLMANRKEQYPSYPLQIKGTSNLLQGMVYCKKCKKAMKRHRSLKNNQLEYTYLCPVYSNEGRCHINRILENKLLNMLCQQVKMQIDIAANIDKLIKRSGNTSNLKEQCQTQLKKLKKDLEHIVLLKGEIYQDYKQGLLDKGEYLLLKEKFIAQGLELETNVADLQLQMQEAEEKEKSLSQSVSDVLHFHDDKEMSIEFFKAFIKRIEISDSHKVFIKYRHDDICIK